MEASNQLPGHRFRRIAVEEAFMSPEMLAEVRKLLAGPNQDSADFHLLHDICGDPPRGLGKIVTERLLDMETARLADMDAHGVDVQLLGLTTPGVQVFDADTAIDVAVMANDQLAEAIRRHPTRFAGLGTVAPQSPRRSAREMERCVHDLKLNGFMINSHTQNEYLDNPKFWPILEAAEALDRCIYLHPRCPSDGLVGPMRDYSLSAASWGFQVEASTHAVRMIASGLFDRFPRLKICLGHLGEGVHFWLSRLDYIMSLQQKMGAIPKFELKPSEYFKRNFVIATSGMEDHLLLQFSIDRLGADGIMWAVDYPYQRTEPAVQFMDSAPISDAIREKIYSGNAERIFHIAPRFSSVVSRQASA